MKKSELRQIIKEEISKVLNEDTFESFKKDFDQVIKYAGISLDGNIITIYLDDEPNKEKNIINKLVREKYIDSLKKIPSEDDVMKFKIIK
jgi:hypothetical protein